MVLLFPNQLNNHIGGEIYSQQVKQTSGGSGTNRGVTWTPVCDSGAESSLELETPPLIGLFPSPAFLQGSPPSLLLALFTRLNSGLHSLIENLRGMRITYVSSYISSQLLHTPYRNISLYDSRVNLPIWVSPHLLPHKCTVLLSSPTQSRFGEIVASNLGSSRLITGGKLRSSW